MCLGFFLFLFLFFFWETISNPFWLRPVNLRRAGKNSGKTGRQYIATIPWPKPKDFHQKHSFREKLLLPVIYWV
jgi:hypothetical protein